MPEKQVSLTLTFATDSDPASVGARVVEIVVAEVPANLIGAHWHGYEVSDEAEPDPGCPHTSWEETPFRLGDGTPVASRKCSDCEQSLPTILLDGPKSRETPRDR
ncbi:hypothetical protein OG352_05435 [Streptomyces sp. NBC_01485]|uniref:hypothetical protein n=1 Tax=Streptomyces sp. NBC_01485 TaxID=2903884 RepID=UPI002E31001A|nr:hypothetical protein [Streptomyces sp. NBC_01485]